VARERQEPNKKSQALLPDLRQGYQIAISLTRDTKDEETIGAQKINDKIPELVLDEFNTNLL
jgi:hypothetical protein